MQSTDFNYRNPSSRFLAHFIDVCHFCRKYIALVLRVIFVCRDLSCHEAFWFIVHVPKLTMDCCSSQERHQHLQYIINTTLGQHLNSVYRWTSGWFNRWHIVIALKELRVWSENSASKFQKQPCRTRVP